MKPLCSVHCYVQCSVQLSESQNTAGNILELSLKVCFIHISPKKLCSSQFIKQLMTKLLYKMYNSRPALCSVAYYVHTGVAVAANINQYVLWHFI